MSAARRFRSECTSMYKTSSCSAPRIGGRSAPMISRARSDRNGSASVASRPSNSGGQQIDPVIDQQTAVDLRRLSDQTAFEQMLGLLARAGDDRVEALADLRSIARQRNLLLQLHELRATAFGGLARRDLIHLRRRREF